MAITVYPRTAVTRPSTSIRVNTDAISGSASEGQKLVMFAGESAGGQPGVAYKFKNYQEAHQVLQSGELLDAIELAWNGVSDGNVASQILALRTQPATQSSYVIDGLTFKSREYSAEANSISVGLSDNALTDTKRVRVVNNKKGTDVIYDNLGSIFSLSYTGDKKYASVQVNLVPKPTPDNAIGKGIIGSTFQVGTDEENTEVDEAYGVGFADSMVLKAGDDAETASIVATIPLGDDSVYNTTHRLINYISTLPGFKAVMFSMGNKNIDTKWFDAMPETVLSTEETWIKAVGGDIKRSMQYDSSIDTDYKQGTTVSNFPMTQLTGGSVGVSPDSWADYFEQFNSENGYYLVPLTDDEAIHAEAVQYVSDRSAMGDPMRVIAGGGTNEPKEQAIQRASYLSSDRFTLVGVSGTRRMLNGTVQKLPGYMVAAEIAGLASGLDVGDSITFKQLDLNAIDQDFNDSDLDQLDSAGVVTVEYVRNRLETLFRISDDPTTDQGTGDPVTEEMAISEANDFLVSALKIHMDDTWIGQKMLSNSQELIKDDVIAFLEEEVRDEIIEDFVSDGIFVTINGSRIDVTVPVVVIRNAKKIVINLIYQNATDLASATNSDDEFGVDFV